MNKSYIIIVRETGRYEGADYAEYVYQKDITLSELKYLLSTVKATKPVSPQSEDIISIGG